MTKRKWLECLTLAAAALTLSAAVNAQEPTVSTYDPPQTTFGQLHQTTLSLKITLTGGLTVPPALGGASMAAYWDAGESGGGGLGYYGSTGRPRYARSGGTSIPVSGTPGSNTATVQVTASLLTVGIHTVTFCVVVSGGAGPLETCTSPSASAKFVVNPALEVPNLTLPAGQVSVPYTATISARGGTPPYSYWVDLQQVPSGLTFNETTGVFGGTPSVPGTFSIHAAAIDRAGSIDVSLSLTISPQASSVPSILTASPLPEATVGAAYPQAIKASGGIGAYTFSIIAGSLPSGLELISESGAFAGSPSQAGDFRFDVRVTDSQSQSATKSFALHVAEALSITTTALPAGIVGQPYPAAVVAASGGTGRYVFSATGSLPPGLELDPDSGAITGTPSAVGTYPFTVTAHDEQNRTASRSLSIGVSLATVTGATVVLDTGTPGADTQQGVAVSLNPPRNDDVTGSLFLEFTPSVTPPVDDPAIVFLNNGNRQRTFRIPAGQGSALFDGPAKALFRTGTVAGSIVIRAQLQAGGVDATPTPPPTSTIVVPAVAPTLTDLTATRSASGLTIVARGFSTPRNMTSAALSFTARPGSNITSGLSFTVNLSPDFTRWYGSESSAAFGSQFQLTLPVSITGDASEITGVSVVLSNSVGAGNSLSATF